MVDAAAAAAGAVHEDNNNNKIYGPDCRHDMPAISRLRSSVGIW